MLPIPFDRFTIHSRLSAAEVVSRLSSCVEKDGIFLGKATYETLRTPSFLLSSAYESSDDIPELNWFRGRLGPTGFRLWRVTGVRNSFLPVINGKLVQTGNGGTDVRVLMTLHPLVAGLYSCLLGASVATAFSSVDQTERQWPLVSCMFGIALVLGGFWSEALKARRIVSKLLESQEPARGSV